jgi:hypothetical protein
MPDPAQRERAAEQVQHSYLAFGQRLGQHCRAGTASDLLLKLVQPGHLDLRAVLE